MTDTITHTERALHDINRLLRHARARLADVRNPAGFIRDEDAVPDALHEIMRLATRVSNECAALLVALDPTGDDAA